MEKQPKKKTNWIHYIWITIAIICFIIAGYGLFQRPLRNMQVSQHTKEALAQSLVQPKKNAEFQSSLKGVTNNPPTPKEKPNAIISIPSIGIKLPVFYNMTDAEMDTGVCTPIPERQLGQNNNFVLAGHHLENQKLLFGRLTNIKQGAIVIITDSQHHTYKYQIDQTKTVDETDTSVMNNTQNATLTLFTCASGTPGTPYRFVATGHLIQ